MLSRSTSARFVGRLAERALLDELLAEARAGRAVTAFVCGEAGAGKTRLVTELVAVASGRGTPALVGSCTAVGRRSFTFAPFVVALRPVVRELASGGGDGKGPVGMALARLVSGPGDRGGEPATAEPAGSGISSHQHLFEQVLDAVERVARHTGLVVVIDDLHWADPSSRDLFEFLARSLHDAGVLLVGTVRTDEPDEPGFLGWLAEVQRAPGATRLDLERFDRDEVAELVAGVRGEPPSAELVGRVFERSGGNAFLAEEILAADERGVLVPPTVKSPVLARMARLSPSARELLRSAAIAGVQVSHGLLAAVAGIDDDSLQAAARELTDNHLLVTDPSQRGYVFRHALTREAVEEDLLPGERQRLHRAVAEALTADPALGPPPTWAAAEAVAEHRFAAGDLAPALAASVAAGDAARQVSAVAAALGHYERALGSWNQVADPEAVAGIGRVQLLDRAAEAASGAGEHERAIHHVDVAIRELEDRSASPLQVGLLCERKARYLGWASQGDATAWTGRAVALVPADPPTSARARVLAAHSFALMVGGARHDEASLVATAALEAARCSGDRKEEARAHGVLGTCLVMTSDDPAAGIRELGHAVAVGRESGDAETVALWSSNLTDALVRLGRFDDGATAGLGAAADAVQASALRNEVAYVLFNAAEALFLAGRWKECEHALGRVRRQHPGGLVDLWGRGLAALLHAVRGADGAAQQAIAEATDLGVSQAEGEATVAAARAHLALHHGDLDAARRAASEGLDAVATDEAEPGMASTTSLADVGLRLDGDRAQLARARGVPAVAEEAADSARAFAARSLTQCLRAAAAAHRPEVARAHRALTDAEVGRAEGRSDPDAWGTVADVTRGSPHRSAYARFREAEAVLASRGDRARAVDSLTAAGAMATELGAAPLGREIEALARRARIELTDRAVVTADGAPPGLADESLGLTTREVEVLRLLAAGYTNPQIGDALYISRKTASHHVSSILAKLGVATRVEAAGVAHRVGLTPGTPGTE